MILRIGIFILATFIYGTVQAQIADKELLTKYVYHLAADSMKGRMAGSKNELKTAHFIDNRFRAFRLDTLPLNKAYFQPFSFTYSNMKFESRNVVGVIRPKTPTADPEYIVIGAHYDHLGFKIRYGDQYDTTYLPGADDNASGVAVLLELTRMLTQQHATKRFHIIIIAFGSEELGLWGSKYFVYQSLVPLNRIKLMINLDMLGMLAYHKKCVVEGVFSVPEGKQLIKRSGKRSGLKFEIKPKIDDWDKTSDHGPFAQADIPVLFFTTDLHPNYHQASDTPEKLDYQGMTVITNYIYKLISNLETHEKL